MSGPRRIVELLGPSDSSLSSLVSQAGQQEHLDRVLHSYLDSPLTEHVRVASVRDGTLVLAADTPVWGHRIRYLAPALLSHMREHVPGLAQVRIIVRPAPGVAPPPPPPAPRTPVPESAAGILEQVAQDCDNPALARVLRRLARRTGAD